MVLGVCVEPGKYPGLVTGVNVDWWISNQNDSTIDRIPTKKFN